MIFILIGGKLFEALQRLGLTLSACPHPLSIYKIEIFMFLMTSGVIKPKGHPLLKICNYAFLIVVNKNFASMNL